VIASLCLALASCVIAPPPVPAPDTVLIEHAERAQARAFLHDVADARALIEWVDAVDAPPQPPQLPLTRPDAPPALSHPTVTVDVSGATGTVNGYPCGGPLPDCSILACESGGNPTAQNPRSSASGLWQFLTGTWNGYGGYPTAADAPPDVQNERAAQVWNGGAGAGHWAQCR
jgi:hypothetical protein